MLCVAYNKNNNNLGFTLVEIMMSVLIFSSIFITVGWVYNQGMQVVETEGDRRIAIILAEQMMDEIMTKDMRDPDNFEAAGACSECVGSYARMVLDDVDDYDGWDRGVAYDLEAMDGTPMKKNVSGNIMIDSFGNPVPDYSQFDAFIVNGLSVFRRQVKVVNVIPQANGTVLNAPGVNTGFLQVTVMVSSLRDFNLEKAGLQIGFLPVILTRVISHTYQ